jgi:hypothetical protein
VLIITLPPYNFRFKKLEATYLKSYKISGADKNIGTVVAVAAYLLGKSSTRTNVEMVAGSELQFFQNSVFGGSELARTGLRMIPAFYHRDYNLLREIYMAGLTGAEAKRMTATLKAHEDRGSFPTGFTLLFMVNLPQKNLSPSACLFPHVDLHLLMTFKHVIHLPHIVSLFNF